MAEKFTAAHFVEFCKRFVGRPYWYGTCVYTCTESRYNSKKKQYPGHYTESRKKKYMQHIAAKEVCSDCVGMIKGYAWTDGGETVFEAVGTGKKIVSKYGLHGCPDKSANGMFKWAKQKGMDHGTIDTIPEIPGVAVCSDGHVGVYVGDGKVVEERGFNYGCVETELARRPWKDWYKPPFTNDGAKPEPKPEDDAEPETDKQPESDPTLRKGDKGDAVKEMQQLLINAGCELPKYGVDGDFGSETRAAVKAFQTAHGLEASGICDAQTWAKLKPEIDAKPKDDKQPEGNDAIEAAKKKPVLHKSDKGDAVKEMQQLLINAGCELPKYGVDGDFGSETRAAVKAFQKSHELADDGVCGVKTWTELLKYVIADG